MRNVLITGASSGVGRALVRQQLASGAKVFATGRSKKRLSHLSAVAADSAERLAFAPADLRSDDDLARVVSDAKRHFSGPVDCLVHAAFGHIGEDEGKSLLDVSTDDLRKFVDDSVTASLLTVRAILPHLKDSHSPRIVFVIADWGLPQHNVLLSGSNDDGAVGSEAFIAGKYALAGLAAAVERQSHVRVSAIYPGIIASWAGEDEEGEPTFLEIDSSIDEIKNAGYVVPDEAIPLSDVAAAVEFMLTTSATVRTLVLKPAKFDYTGI